MTDEELNQRLDGWQVSVTSIVESVMDAVTDIPTDTALLADLLTEVRGLRQEMRGLRAEVEELRQTVTASSVKPAPHRTIKGYPLLPFAPPQDELPFYQ